MSWSQKKPRNFNDARTSDQLTNIVSNGTKKLNSKSEYGRLAASARNDFLKNLSIAYAKSVRHSFKTKNHKQLEAENVCVLQQCN